MHYGPAARFARGDQMTVIHDAQVKSAFEAFPLSVRADLLKLRELVLQAAYEHPDIGAIEETLKWGEPSYLVEGGSAIRLGVPKHATDAFAVYFNCNTTLVATFREVHADTFRYEGNRAIVFDKSEHIDETAIKHCFGLALRYHHLKRLPMLGV